MIHRYCFFLLSMIIGCNPLQSQILDTLVKVGNHQLHFKIVKGKGTPILFESGNGDDASVWEPLLKSIHNETGATLITYDRAGLGSSDIDTTSISFQQEIIDLRTGLKTLGFKEDYFLVAHSFGAMYASEFAKNETIKGAVFIDVSTPCNLDQEYTTRVKNTITEDIWKLLKQRKTGLYYVLKKFPDIAAYMPDRYIADTIPVTIIVAENYKPTAAIGETDKDMLVWQQCLKNFGNLSNHTYVETKNTDHKVWEKDPETVIKETVKLYRQVNK